MNGVNAHLAALLPHVHSIVATSRHPGAGSRPTAPDPPYLPLLTIPWPGRDRVQAAAAGEGPDSTIVARSKAIVGRGSSVRLGGRRRTTML
jgi:hypothetical protein